jgi:hypothetical protein
MYMPYCWSLAMAYARLFQLFKTVLLVAGLRAGRPGKEKQVLRYSQILLI